MFEKNNPFEQMFLDYELDYNLIYIPLEQIFGDDELEVSSSTETINGDSRIECSTKPAL